MAVLGTGLVLAAMSPLASGSGAIASASTRAAGTNEASAPGVTATTVTVGLLTSLTGGNASTYTGAVTGARARFQLQNAQGGVDGRKIELVAGDDESSPTESVPAVETMVTHDNAFAVLAVTGLFFTAAPYLQKNGIPAVGSSADGNEWFTKKNSNMFSFLPTSANYPQYTGTASFMKAHGVTDVASLGYAIAPSSSAAAQGFATAAQREGLKVGYLNDTVPFAGVNVTTDALSMKSANVNGIYLPLAEDTNIALLVAAKQGGVNLKAAVLATGYGSTLLATAGTVQSLQGAYFETGQTPVELHTTATDVEQAALKKYAHFSGVPGYGYTEGWLSADLFIRGLEVAGKNPTRPSFIAGLRKVKSYDGGGLLPQAVNLSQAFGPPPKTSCSYMVQLKGTAFVPVPSNGKPVCGTLIPGS